MITTPFFGDRGCHVRIHEEAKNLQRRGIDVVVATYPTGQDVPGIPIRRALSVPGLRPSVLGPSYGRPLLDALLLATALRAARETRPQIVHAHLHEGILIGAIVRRLTGATLVADLQGGLKAELVDHQFLDANSRAAGAVDRLEHWLMRQPDALLVSSAAALPELALQHVPADRIFSLPDGVDLQQFHPMPADEGLLDRFHLRGKRIVVFLGVLTEYQGVNALIDAIPAVAEAIPDVHFLIMGYPNEERYRALVAARGLQRWATLPGRVPFHDAARWLSLGTLAISAKVSLTAANGKLVNYMACGLPVVANGPAVNRELLGEAGIYSPVGDPQALAARLGEIRRAPERRRALGMALRCRAETHFDWGALTDRLIDVSKRLARRSLLA